MANSKATLTGAIRPARPATDRRRAHGARRGGRHAQDKLLPRVTRPSAANIPIRRSFARWASLGLLGPTIPEQYGGAGLNYVCYGLIARD